MIADLLSRNGLIRSLARYRFGAQRLPQADYVRLRRDINRLIAVRRMPSAHIPSLTFQTAFPGIEGRTVSMCGSSNGPNDLYSVCADELLILSLIVRDLAPKTIFEFGTFNGTTAVHFAMNSPDQCQIVTLDALSGDLEVSQAGETVVKCRIGEMIVSSPYASKITIITGDSTRYDFSRYYATMDFIFVDADHSYSSVLADSAAALRMAVPGSIIMWHDYLLLDGVTRALDEIASTKQLRHLSGTSLVFHRVSV
jgi:predicted O-methyltransferase YrrM